MFKNTWQKWIKDNEAREVFDSPVSHLKLRFSFSICRNEAKSVAGNHWLRLSPSAGLLETDRNPNFDYRQKPNILLNPKYSANCRIAEYRIVPTISANLSLFGFGRIFG